MGKNLSKGQEEDDFEIELIEIQRKIWFRKIVLMIPSFGMKEGKIIKAIHAIESGKFAYNKLKAFEKTVLLCLMLTECSRIDGKISSEDLSLLKSIFSEQFAISSNVMTVVIEKELGYSITKKVEQLFIEKNMNL